MPKARPTYWNAAASFERSVMSACEGGEAQIVFAIVCSMAY